MPTAGLPMVELWHTTIQWTALLGFHSKEEFGEFSFWNLAKINVTPGQYGMLVLCLWNAGIKGVPFAAASVSSHTLLNQPSISACHQFSRVWKMHLENMQGQHGANARLWPRPVFSQTWYIYESGLLPAVFHSYAIIQQPWTYSCTKCFKINKLH